MGPAGGRRREDGNDDATRVRQANKRVKTCSGQQAISIFACFDIQVVSIMVFDTHICHGSTRVHFRFAIPVVAHCIGRWREE